MVTLQGLPSRPCRRGRRGFSLVEVAIATAIMGLAMTALMASLTSGTQLNSNGRQITTANFLAQELREWTLRLPFKDPDTADAGNAPGPDGSDPQTFVDDLDDLLNVTFSPPRDGRGVAISNLSGWSQTITMTWRDPASLSTIRTAGTTDAIQVQATISYQGRQVLVDNWLVMRRS